MFAILISSLNYFFIFKFKGSLELRLRFVLYMPITASIALTGFLNVLEHSDVDGENLDYFNTLMNIPAATAVPITPATFGPIACIKR